MSSHWRLWDLSTKLKKRFFLTKQDSFSLLKHMQRKIFCKIFVVLYVFSVGRLIYLLIKNLNNCLFLSHKFPNKLQQLHLHNVKSFQIFNITTTYIKKVCKSVHHWIFLINPSFVFKRSGVNLSGENIELSMINYL